MILAVVLALNPVFHVLGKARVHFQPDSIAYIWLASNYPLDASLCLPGYETAGRSLILPIFYPFFISLVNVFTENILYSAFLAAYLLAIATSFGVYFIARELSGRVAAFGAVILVQISAVYFQIGTTPLTESGFLFVISLILALTLGTVFRKGPHSRSRFALLGATCGIAFLTRHIGGYLGLLVALWVILEGLLRMPKRLSLAGLVFLAAGWCVVFFTYAGALYLQTGQGPFQQRFSPSPPTVVRDPFAVSEILLFRNAGSKNYSDIWSKRRRLRQLLPDNSAMLSEVRIRNESGSGVSGEAIFVQRLSLAVRSPGRYFGNLGRNLGSLRDSDGRAVFWLFLLFSATAVLAGGTGRERLKRLLIPGFVFSYLLILSIITSSLERYVSILTVFCLVHVVCEGYRLLDVLAKKLAPKNGRPVTLLAGCAFFALVAVALHPVPASYKDAFKPRSSLEDFSFQFEPFRALVQGEAVLCLHPAMAFLSGGQYRVLPNDSLEDIRDYARQTGVSWMIVSRGRGARKEYRANKCLHSWYPALLNARSDVDGAVLREVSPNGYYYLYELM